MSFRFDPAAVRAELAPTDTGWDLTLVHADGSRTVDHEPRSRLAEVVAGDELGDALAVEEYFEHNLRISGYVAQRIDDELPPAIAAWTLCVAPDD